MKRLSFILMLGAITSSLVLNFNMVHAADRDFVDLTTGKSYEAVQYQNEISLRKEILSIIGSGHDISYERDGRKYNFYKLNEKIEQNPDKSVSNVIQEAKNDDSLLISSNNNEIKFEVDTIE